MNSDKKVSIAVIRRLPRYFRYLYDLIEVEINRISSRELASKMGVTASQIRQDLNCFGGFGQQGYGYNVESLYNAIGEILGINNNYKMVIIGAGNMGQALANYGNFGRRGFQITGIFDINPRIIGKKIRDMEIMHLDKLEEFVGNNHVDIAVLTVPYDATPVVAERAAKLGIKGLWNFSPMDLKMPHGVIVENVHLSDGLMVLGYKLNQIE